jgi:hypothetical protein
MNRESPLESDRRDLEHSDGSKTLVWVRRGRIHLAVIGAAAALAAGSAGAVDPASGDVDQTSTPPPAAQAD